MYDKKGMVSTNVRGHILNRELSTPPFGLCQGVSVAVTLLRMTHLYFLKDSDVLWIISSCIAGARSLKYTE